MELVFSEEQEELRRTVREFCADKAPSSEVRRLMETDAGYDPAVWSQLADQMGLVGVAVPEEYGGAGFSFVELVIAQEEMGAALLPVPYFASAVLAAQALLHCGDESAKKDLLPGVAAGSTVATLAFTEDDGRWDADGITLAARRDGAQWLLDGTKAFVVDGHVAGLVLVLARTGSGLTLFAVDGDAPGLDRTAMPTLDQTRKLARLEFTGVPARLIGEEGAAGPVLARTLDLAAVALAAEQVGGAARVLDMTVEYAKVRHQFGRPVGSFQAIKHKCADMLLEVESARSAVQFAASAAAEDSPELPMIASLAKAYCSDAYFNAAAESIQIHGGIGFTWEHDAHLYFKRAKSSQLFLGDSSYHRERLVQRIGI